MAEQKKPQGKCREPKTRKEILAEARAQNQEVLKLNPEALLHFKPEKEKRI